jgi:Lamin Tail Domain
MRRIREIAGGIGLTALVFAATFAGCADGDDAGGASDAGLGRPDVGAIDPVYGYGQREAGLVIGSGGGGEEDLDGATPVDGGSAVGAVINEVDYDQVSTDDAEYVEIFNPTQSILDLRNVALVLVDATAEYGRVDLTGSLAPGKFLLVASPSVAGPDAGAARLPLPTSSNALRNGTAAVGLLDKTTGKLLDALSYAGSVTAATVTGVAAPLSFVEGTATPAVDSNTAPGALSRIPNGVDSNNATADFKFSATPTPGGANVP